MPLAWYLLLLLMCTQSASANLSPTRDFYKTLGLPKDATSAQIKKAYRKLALEHHPDKGGSEEKFKAISEAYDVLGDKEKRKRYDQFGDAGVNPNFGGGGGGGSPQPDFFQFFQQQQPGDGGANLFQQTHGMGGINLDLGEILRGMMSGEASSGGTRRKSCQQQRKPPKPRWYTRPVRCTLEDLSTGTTKRMKVQHSVRQQPWQGTSRMVSKVYTVKIRPGWKAGTKIKFPPTKDGIPGIAFILEEIPHKHLKRRGDDLFYKCRLTETEAQSEETKISVPLPDELFVFQLESQVQTGDVRTVRGRGMPIKGGPARGNLFIEFFVGDVSSRSTAAK